MRWEAINDHTGLLGPLALMPAPPFDDLSRAGFGRGISHHSDNGLIAIDTIEVQISNGFAQAAEMSVAFDEAGVGGGLT